MQVCNSHSCMGYEHGHVPFVIEAIVAMEPRISYINFTNKRLVVDTGASKVGNQDYIEADMPASH